MVLSNVFRLDGYECLHWIQLAPEARGIPDQLNLLLKSFLKLRDLGYLTAWRVGPQGVGTPTPHLELWHFWLPSTAPDEDAEKALLEILPGLEVVANGTWSPKSSQTSVASALVLALAHKIERAFLHLSYRRFKDIYIRVGDEETALDSGLPACKVDLLASPSALFLQAHVSRRNVRSLRHSDLASQEDLTVIVSPSGERASVLCSSSSELVARLEQLSINGGGSDSSKQPEKRAQKKRNKYVVQAASKRTHSLHVEVAFEKRTEGDGGAWLLTPERKNSSEHGELIQIDEPLRDSGAGNTPRSRAREEIVIDKTDSRIFQQNVESFDKLIFAMDRVLVPLPRLQEPAVELRDSWTLEGAVSKGKPALGGWPSQAMEETAESSESDSGSSREDKNAEETLHNEGVKSNKRSDPEARREEDAPAQKVQRVEGEGFEVLASKRSGGDSWWSDDGMEVGLLADFADFGDAFADAEGFGDLPGPSREGSPSGTSHPPKAPSLPKPSPLGQDFRPKTAVSEASTFVQPSPKAEESEPFRDLFNELLFQRTPSLSPGGKNGAAASRSGSVHQQPSGGDLDEAGLLLCCPPPFRVRDVSLPCSSDEGATVARYAPEEKVVEFVQAVLGPSERTAYEALPPTTPETGSEVQLRGKYIEAVGRKKRNEDSNKENPTGRVLEGLLQEGGATEHNRVDIHGSVKKFAKDMPPSEHNEKSSAGPWFERRPTLSTVASDLVLLQREASARIAKMGLLVTGPALESGAMDCGEPSGGLEGAESVVKRSQTSAGADTNSKYESQRTSGALEVPDMRRKLRPLSPLLLQQALTGIQNYPRPFGTGAADNELPISMAAAAEVLTGEVAEALGIAFGSEHVCGPLTVEQLCDDPEASAGVPGKPSQPMQVGSPAIEHPVTPPQLPIKSPGGALSAGNTGPPHELLAAPNEEDGEPHVNVFRMLAPPPFLVGYQEDWLRIPQGVLKLWEKAPLEPYAAPKRVVYYAFCMQELVPLCGRFLREVGSIYQVCQLGTHVAASLPPDLATPDVPGVVALPPTAMQRLLLKSIRSVVDRLRLPGVYKRSGKEDSEEPCIVLYVVLPWTGSEDTWTTIAEIAALFSGCEEASNQPSASKVRQVSLAETRLTLKLLSVRDLQRLGTEVDALSTLKGIAFDVYTMARGTNRKLPSGSGARSVQSGLEFEPEKRKGSEGMSSETSSPERLGPLLFEPPVILASCPPICPVVATRQLEEGEAGELEAGEHAPEAGVPLYCCYAWANEGAKLVSVWTDGHGELLDAYVQSDEEGIGNADETSKKGEQGDPSANNSEGAQTCSFKLLEGLLDQSETLLALTDAALSEGEPRLPCHVNISCLGVMSSKELADWAKLILRRHCDIRQVLPMPGVTQTNRSRQLQDRRSLSLEIEKDPLELDRFIEQQYASPASPAIAQCASGGGLEKAFHSPPDMKNEESRGLLASITLVALESEDGLQLLHGTEDQKAGRFSLPVAVASAKNLLYSRNDHLLVPSKALQQLVNYGEADQHDLESFTRPVTCGYLLNSLENSQNGFGTGLGDAFGAGDRHEDWPITTRVALMSHFSFEEDGVGKPPFSEGEIEVQANRLVTSIAEGFQALSWMNARDGGSRTSALPMHAAMAEQLKILVAAGQSPVK